MEVDFAQIFQRERDPLCVADGTVQIYGGMGLMEELPVQRLWRDSRLERIWDGTSEIQRHIISRSILRPLGA